MSLSFPSHFPKALLRSVVAVQATVEPDFRKSLRQVPVDHSRMGSVPDRQAYRELCASYVRKLVLSFAHQACEAARAREISLDEVAWYIDDFIRRATVHAFYDFHLRRAWGRWESFRDDLDPAIHESDGWRVHNSELAAVAEGLVEAESTNSPDSPVSLKPRSPDVAPERATEAENIFRPMRDGRWEIAYGVQRAVVGRKTTKRGREWHPGLKLIHSLLPHPREEFYATELVGQDVRLLAGDDIGVTTGLTHKGDRVVVVPPGSDDEESRVHRQHNRGQPQPSRRSPQTVKKVAQLLADTEDQLQEEQQKGVLDQDLDRIASLENSIKMAKNRGIIDGFTLDDRGPVG